MDSEKLCLVIIAWQLAALSASKPNNKPFFKVYLAIALMTPFQFKASHFWPMSKLPQGWDNLN